MLRPWSAMDFIMVGKCALHKPWKTRSVQLKPNQLTPVIHTARPLASTTLLPSTCSQSEAVLPWLELVPTEELVFTELDVLVATDVDVLVAVEVDELVFTELEVLVATDVDELVFTELEVLVATEVAELVLLDVAELVLVATEVLLLVVVPPQILPEIVGFSAVLLALVPWKPNSTVWPTPIVPFQLRLVAEYGLAPVKVAFQLLVILSPAYCQETVQPLTGAVPLLVTRMAPVNPSVHSLVMTYWQPAEAVSAIAAKASKAKALRRHSEVCLRIVNSCYRSF